MNKKNSNVQHNARLNLINKKNQLTAFLCPDNDVIAVNSLANVINCCYADDITCVRVKSCDAMISCVGWNVDDPCKVDLIRRNINTVGKENAVVRLFWEWLPLNQDFCSAQVSRRHI